MKYALLFLCLFCCTSAFADSISDTSTGAGVLSYDKYGFLLSKDGVQTNITPIIELKSGSFKVADYGNAFAEVKGKNYEFTYNISIPNNGTGTAFTSNVMNITFLQTSDKPLKVIGTGIYSLDHVECNNIVCNEYYVGTDYSSLFPTLQQNYTVLDRDGKTFTTYSGVVPYTIKIDKNNVGRVVFDVSNLTFAKGQTIVLDPTISIINVQNYTSITNNITTEAAPLAHITINDSNITMYLPFDVNQTTANTTYDYSSYNNDGKIILGAQYNTTGIIGNAYAFDGSNDEIDIPYSNSLNTTTGMTIALWMKANNNGKANLGVLLTFGSGSTSLNRGWILIRDSSSGALRFKQPFTTTDVNMIGNTAIFNKAWQFVVITTDMSGNTNNLHLYINGTEDTYGTKTNGSGNYLGPRTTDNFIIGDSSVGDTNFNGVIDEVMQYNRSLSASEVAALYKFNLARYAGPPATQRFENLTIGQDGTVNSINITSNTTLLNNSQLAVRVWEYSATKVNTRNSSWQYLANGNNVLNIFGIGVDTYNISIEYNFSAGSNSFYSPVLQDTISIPTYQGGVLVSSNGTLTVSSLVNNISSEPYPMSHILLNDTDLVLYMPFDVNLTQNNANVTYDYTRYSNDGISNNKNRWNTSGQIGGAMQFDGSASKITVSDATSIQNMANFTMGAWIKPYSFGGASKGRVMDKVGAILWDTNNVDCTSGIDFLLSFDSGGSLEVCANNAISTNTWQHVVVMYNATGATAGTCTACMAIYINGTSRAVTSITTTSGARLTDAGVLAIGSRSTDSIRVFDGLIDEAIIYNRTMTASEVNALYQSRLARYAGPPALQEFDNISLGQNGSFNFINLTTNATILNNSNLSVIVLQIGSNGVNVLNSSVYYLPSGTNQVTNINLSANPTNITLLFNFTTGGTNFYSPVLQDIVQVTNAQVPNATGGGGGTTPIVISSVIAIDLNGIISFRNNSYVQMW